MLENENFHGEHGVVFFSAKKGELSGTGRQRPQIRARQKAAEEKEARQKAAKKNGLARRRPR